MVVHKHTQYPGPGRTNENVVGYPFMPVYTAKAGGFFFIVFGVIALMSALVTINPIWVYGPYDPSPVTAGSQPDWYMGFADGALRLLPGLPGVHRLGLHVQLQRLHPGAILLIPVLYGLAGALPVPRAVGHRRQARAPPARPPAQRPDPHRARRHGAGRSTCMLFIAAGNDIIAIKLHLSINDITNILRLGVLRRSRRSSFWVTKRICLEPAAP